MKHCTFGHLSRRVQEISEIQCIWKAFSFAFDALCWGQGARQTNSPNPVRLNLTGWDGNGVQRDNGFVCVDILEPTAYSPPQHASLGLSLRPPVPHTCVQPSQLACRVSSPLQPRGNVMFRWVGIICLIPAPQYRHCSSSSSVLLVYLQPCRGLLNLFVINLII